MNATVGLLQFLNVLFLKCVTRCKIETGSSLCKTPKTRRSNDCFLFLSTALMNIDKTDALNVLYGSSLIFVLLLLLMVLCHHICYICFRSLDSLQLFMATH